MAARLIGRTACGGSTCCFAQPAGACLPPQRLACWPRHAAARHRRLIVHTAPIDLDALDLSIPDIDGDVRSIQQELGAQFNEAGVATTFGNPRQAIDALASGVVLVDRSHWGRLRVTGEGRATFLHGQSTNDLNRLQPGQGCDTVFVTSTARTLDLATVLVSGSSSLLLVSPSTKDLLMQRLDKFIFPGDNVTVQDVSARCAMLSLLGPESENVLKEIAGDALTILGQPYGTHQLLKFRSGPVFVMVGSGLAAPGFTLIADESVAGDLFALLASKGCILMGSDEWEVARVLEGRPAPGAELTEEVNPLEAGLAHAVSVDKGCYIGQETLAKVWAKGGVKQLLWGLQLEGPVAAGSTVSSTDGARVGRVTSVAVTPRGEHIALAYLRSKDSQGQKQQWEGAKVQVEGVQAQVVAPPFATRTVANELPEGVCGPGADAALKAQEEELRLKAAAAEAARAEKAERLRAMQERLAAWQAQHGAAFKAQ